MGTIASRTSLRDLKPYPRKMKHAGTLSPDLVADLKRQSHNLLRVMSYNLLADRLCTHHRYSYSLSEARQFNQRAARILEEIKESSCDIVCMQELEHEDFYLSELDSLGYNTSFRPR